MITRFKTIWGKFAERRPTTAQFLMFFIVSNGITVLQLGLMPLLRRAFENTALVDTAFQVFPVGTTPSGATHYIFNFAAGSLPHGGGGLAFFLAVQITILIAQVINFFAQRSVTFKSNSSIGKAAAWYAIAYVAITFVAAAAAGLYQTPIYTLFMETWGLGATGETLADVVTMIINSAISFWVFFPIFKLIFKQVPEDVVEIESGSESAIAAGAPNDSVEPVTVSNKQKLPVATVAK
jgi:hypothetical protein